MNKFNKLYNEYIKEPVLTFEGKELLITINREQLLQILKYGKDLEIVLDNIKNNSKRIIDYGFDYDGFNNVEDLKKLIDMLVDYARKNNELLEEIE